MSIIYKYWTREFIKYFFIVQLIVLSIFVSVDYLTNLDEFLKSGYPLIKSFGYVLLKVPFMFGLLTPAGVVLSVIVVMGVMNRNNELLAMKGSGISNYYLVKPAAAAGLLLAAFMFFLGETLVPVTMAKANDIKYNKIRKNDQMISVKSDIWMRGDHSISHLKYYNPANQQISGVSLTSFKDGFQLATRINAEWGFYKDGKWYLNDVLEQRFTTSSGDPEAVFYKSKGFVLEFVPEDFEVMAKKSDEMSFSDLAAYIGKVEREGYDATAYRVDLYGKTAFPFICLIMALTGAAAGMRNFVKESLPLGIALGLGISFAYWVMYGFCTSLGYGRMLSPMISAWTTNLFFVIFSSLFLISSGE